MIQKMIKPENYHNLGRYKVPLIYWYNCLPTVKKPLKGYEQLIPWNEGIYLDGYIFLHKEIWELTKQRTIEAIKNKNDNYFSDFYNLSKKVTNQVSLLSRQLLKSKKLTIQQINKFFSAFNDMEYPWFYSLAMGEGLESVLNDLAKAEAINAETLQSFFIQEKPTYTIKQQRELVAMKKKLSPVLLKTISEISVANALLIIKKQKPTLYKEIKQHVKRYQWFGMMHFWGEPLSEEKCLQQLLSIKVNNTKVKKIKLNKNQQRLKEQAVNISYWRQMCADVCAIASYSIMKVVDEAGREKSSLGYEKLMWLTPPELISVLKGKLMPNIALLKEREKGYGYIQLNGKRELFTGQALQKMLAQFIIKTKRPTEIRGSIANKGIVRGRIKIVLKPSEIDKVKLGDIMVSGETTPDFIPAISKAAAIIADVGGISSHAAIISREFNIPCIVGTKIATQVLKDNDLVEVDADHGIIRLIN